MPNTVKMVALLAGLDVWQLLLQKRGLRLMSRTQLLQCPECGGSYRNAGALAKHLRSFHDLKIVDHKSRTHRKNKLSFLEEMEMDKKEKEGRIPSHFTALLDEAIKEVKLIRERLQAQRG